MTAPFSPPPAIDLLGQAIACIRPLLMDENRTTKERIHILWAAAKNSRDLGASDVVHDEFMQVAVAVNLIDKHGRWADADVRERLRRFGRDDVSHVVQWAMRGVNPFEEGPLT